MRFVDFDYKNKKIVITRSVGNVIHIERISWAEMHVRTMEGLRRLHEVKI